MADTTPVWDYWRPHEGEHILDPNELHVGIIDGDDVHLAAVLPPWVTPVATFQAEGFAIRVRESNEGESA